MHHATALNSLHTPPNKAVGCCVLPLAGMPTTAAAAAGVVSVVLSCVCNGSPAWRRCRLLATSAATGDGNIQLTPSLSSTNTTPAQQSSLSAPTPKPARPGKRGTLLRLLCWGPEGVRLPSLLLQLLGGRRPNSRNGATSMTSQSAQRRAHKSV